MINGASVFTPEEDDVRYRTTGLAEAFKTSNGGFEVTLAPQHRKGTLLAKLSVEHARKHGLELKHTHGFGVYDLPTGCPYGVTVRNTFPNTKFTFEEITVGVERVDINGGDTIFYSGLHTISAYKTGSQRSFLFHSPDSTEKAANNWTPDGSNVIKIKVQRHVKQDPPRVRSAYRGLSDDDGDVGPTFRSLSGGEASRGLSGGNTISGNTFVGHVSTVPLEGTWKKEGDVVEFLIQLVNTQSEQDKARDNAKYHAAMDAMLQKEIDDKKAKRKRLEEEMDALDQEIEDKEAKRAKIPPVSRPTEDLLLPVS
jgi:hypothetical protein